MAALGEMSAGVSHEINNPVFIILGKIAIIKKQIENNNLNPDKLIQELNSIEKASERISTVVKGLRIFSRNSENEPMYNFSLANAFNDVLCFYTEKFKYHNIKLTMNDEAFKGVLIRGRISQFEQVLVNLLNNSFDAIQNLDTRWVRIESEIQVDQIKISIIDSGRGIPAHIQEKIMQPFFTTKDVGKGIGISLSVCKGIIEDHGGQLYYDSSSQNTKFTIQLPLIKQVLKETA